MNCVDRETEEKNWAQWQRSHFYELYVRGFNCSRGCGGVIFPLFNSEVTDGETARGFSNVWRSQFRSQTLSSVFMTTWRHALWQRFVKNNNKMRQGGGGRGGRPILLLQLPNVAREITYERPGSEQCCPSGDQRGCLRTIGLQARSLDETARQRESISGGGKWIGWGRRRQGRRKHGSPKEERFEWK